MKVGLFFGSTTGNTEDIANKIADELKNQDLDVDVQDVSEIEPNQLLEYDKLVLASSTWHDGQLQDDWSCIYDDLEAVDFSGKEVGLVGLGDQEGYSDTFLNSIGFLAKTVIEKGGKVVGRWSAEGYDFDESDSLDENGDFFGLALDQENQDDLTDERIAKWVTQIKSEFSAN